MKPTQVGWYTFDQNKGEILMLDRLKRWYIITAYGEMEPVEWCEDWEGHVELLMPWQVGFPVVEEDKA